MSRNLMAPTTAPATLCHARAKTTGKQCTRPVVAGSTVCRYHGGAAPQVQRAAAARVIGSAFGIPANVDVHEALTLAVQEAAGNVEYLRHYVEELTTDTAEPGEEPTNGLIRHGAFGAYVDPVFKLYNDERDRLARMAKAALDAGVAERQVKIAEGQGRAIAEAARLTFGDKRLGLSAEQQTLARSVFVEHLRTLALS